MGLYKVKDNSDLVRDPITGSIINTNGLDHEKYVTRRDATKIESQKTQNIEEDLANLKSEMNEIKSLLKELVSNG